MRMKLVFFFGAWKEHQAPNGVFLLFPSLARLALYRYMVEATHKVFFLISI